MTVTEVTVLYWIKDLDTSDKDLEELGKLVYKSWDSAEAEGVAFTVEDCRKIGHKHWESVRQNQLTLSWTNGGNNGLVVSGDSNTKTKKKKKKPAKKGNTPKQPEEETIQAAQKTKEKKGPQTKNPVYCFRCSSPSHQARECDKKGDRVLAPC